MPTVRDLKSRVLPAFFPTAAVPVGDLFFPGFHTERELRSAGFKAVGNDVQVAKNCTIVGLANIELGDNVRIDGYTTISVPEGGHLRIGSYVHIAAYSSLIAGDGIDIGDFAGLSQGVRVYSRSDDYSGKYLTNPTIPAEFTGVKRGAVVIGKHVILGAGAIILPGVHIEEGAAIGALSLVNKSLTGWSVYFGAPARKISARSRELLALESQLLARKSSRE